MADEASEVQTIVNNVQTLHEALQRAAANINGLLGQGVATCDEVRAYNLWAMATFNAQRGMLATIRAAGQTDVPELPPAPPLFAWRGVPGDAALNIDCTGEEQSLSGAMKRALRGPTSKSKFLSANDVVATTAIPPASAPSFAALSAKAGLGFAVLPLIIAGIAITAVSVAVVALFSYLKSSNIQEANTKQIALQAQAFANYTDARLQCQQRCTQNGGQHDACVSQCKELIGKPDIRLPDDPFSSEWGFLQWTGFTVLLGVGGLVAWKAYERKKSGRPIFQMPSMP